MQIEFDDNECTAKEFTDWMTQLYGRQLTGSLFTLDIILNWARIGKIPIAYGGYKVIGTEDHKYVGKLLRLEGFSREDMSYIEAVEVKPDKGGGRRPKRTKLYYEILRQPVPPDALPNNWKEIGIHENQLGRRSKR